MRTPQKIMVPELPGVERADSILVVDDDEDIRQTLATLLEAEGYDVNLAVDGADALRALADGPLPDVILLDLAMPRVDGREFRLRQRNDPRLAGIPVIVISAERGMTADPSLVGSHFLRKPVDFGLVRQAIHRVLAEGARRSSPPPQELARLLPDAP
jgi:two-component system chemotaxis response regulator CheY